ncbi:MAG: LysR substrate-binding domain-containing protein [Pseudomonadota bacterium]
MQLGSGAAGLALQITTAEQLGHARIIGYIPDILYAPELSYLDELPIRAKPQLRSSSINAQHRMIASGAGAGILPCFIGDIDPQLRRVLCDLSITRSFWLATHRETHPFPQVRLFINWMVDLTSRHRTLLMGDLAALSVHGSHSGRRDRHAAID